MLQPILLASASPRRKALLESCGLTLIVVAPHADETWPGGDAVKAATELARRKLDKVARQDLITVAADTVVVLGEEPLGKPVDAADATRMLGALSGQTHRVVTGFCVAKGTTVVEGAVMTEVKFRELTQAEIAQYVESGEPFDKAGAYAIQGLGGFLVDTVAGSYTNVVGLPVAEVLAAVRSLQ